MTQLLFFDFSNNIISLERDSLLGGYVSVYEHLASHSVAPSFSLSHLFYQHRVMLQGISKHFWEPSFFCNSLRLNLLQIQIFMCAYKVFFFFRSYNTCRMTNTVLLFLAVFVQKIKSLCQDSPLLGKLTVSEFQETLNIKIMLISREVFGVVLMLPTSLHIMM